jgi:hypothetical protein
MDDTGGGGFGETRIRRPVAALDFRDLAPAKPGPAPRFETVDPTTLLVDEAYQRELSPKSHALIRKIVGGWDWARFKPPIVAATAEGFEVIDGQHTVIAAASHPDIAAIPVMIVEAPRVEDRAGAFIGHNRDRLHITPIQMHVAGVAAHDPDALTVERVCARAGVRLLGWSPSASDGYAAGDCVAYTTLYAMLGRRGAATGRRILECLVRGERAPIAAWQIKAVEELICGAEYHGQVEAEAISEALREIGDDLERQAQVFGAQHRLSKQKATAVILFRRTTRGRRKIA